MPTKVVRTAVSAVLEDYGPEAVGALLAQGVFPGRPVPLTDLDGDVIQQEDAVLWLAQARRGQRLRPPSQRFVLQPRCY